jgi:hypothetical protein
VHEQRHVMGVWLHVLHNKYKDLICFKNNGLFSSTQTCSYIDNRLCVLLSLHVSSVFRTMLKNTGRFSSNATIKSLSTFFGKIFNSTHFARIVFIIVSVSIEGVYSQTPSVVIFRATVS